jgi:AraC-like DNA-binding protein
MARLIRSASLSGYAALAQSVGLDPVRMLRRAGVDPRALADPEMKIDVRAVRELLESSAAESGVEDFGLRLAARRRLSNLGPLSLVVREEDTARKALDTLVRYLRLHNESILTRIEDAGGMVIIHCEIIAGKATPVRQSIELALAVLHRILRELLGPNWEARRVCFAHAPPASLAGHVRAFGRFVEFDCEFNGIVCAARDLDAPLPAADPVMAGYAKHYLRMLFVRPDMTTAEKLRQVAVALLPLGRFTVDQAARHLGIDRRTIHRHLARDGETFSSLVDKLRAELALRHLESGERSLTEVSELLGFSALSAFSRWFRRSFGSSVSTWRARRAARG